MSDPSSLEKPARGRPSIRPTYNPETFGKVSERVARFLGSWRFIAWMSILILAWVIYNVIATDPADPYPFIFLTLLLSLQASYAAPLILLAQNRQDDRDRIQIKEDRERTERLIADTEYLAREIAALRIGLGEVVTRDYLRRELRALLEDLERDEA
ncbi:MAG: DUF1003 domain-containing protein [Candidatus Nanopelagicales bacterium]|mgnify:FL=1|jgi:uncharacterized membrane protein|nr:DUF1003 domain-containing protein [Actinomycetota bacterium]HNE89253.1 DUF1003 domain-containing protein [Actinomycetota bacterium]